MRANQKVICSYFAKYERLSGYLNLAIDFYTLCASFSYGKWQ
jgi:hypothetical protein